MNKYVLVTSFNKDGFEKYGRRMLDSVAKHWSSDIDIRIWYHDFDLLAEDGLPEADHITYHNLNDVSELILFRNRLKDFEPPNWRMDVVKFCHKVFAITETCRSLVSDPEDQTPYSLLWLDGDTVTTDRVEPAWLDSILDLSHDVTLLERPVADYAETSFMRFALWPDREAAFNVLEDVRAAYDSLEVRGYREWHDGFVFQRIINLHQNHGLLVQNLSPEAKTLDAFHTSPLADKMEHFKGAKKDKKAATNAPKEIPIMVQPKDSMPDDYIKNNIVENVKLIDRWVERCRVHRGTGVVVSAGPSVDYDLLRQEYYDGKQVSKSHILCVKHALPHMHKAGIVPWGCIVLDPRPIDGESTHGIRRKDLFENFDKRTYFFVASMTDPSVTRYLIERGANIIGFHAYSNAIQRVAQEEDFPLDPDTVYITGGTCAATRAVGLLHTLGFRRATMLGLDGSFPEPPDEEKNDKIMSHDGKEREKYLSVKINDRQFWTTGELLAMAQDCERLFDKTDMDMELEFVGEDTLCAETWKNRKLRKLQDLKDIARGY
ncbi:MAG: 6-hydroxymethylpterin diphosphokinase MptE-like protein [Pseudohongiellaceae bacterium]